MSSNRKTLSLSDLLSLRERARAAGKTVVHCHGCFDIVHPGHIEHMQFARSLGDLLVVSVSADSQVNKGVDRPLIPEALRASSVGALECVDAVYVNSAPTAVELLETLRPDVYVKGREYAQSHDPRFLAEQEAVERVGGRVVFSSSDVVYSSTALIGRIAQHDRFNDEKVSRFRDRYGLSAAHLCDLSNRAQGQRVVVIGDYLLDRYHFCHANGVAGEAPMMSLRTLQTQDFDGGVGVIALHLAAQGATPVMVSALADDETSTQVELRLRAAGIELHCPRLRRDTIRKHRYLAEQTKLFKVDEGSPAPADTRVEQQLADIILAAAQGASAVIFADFGYGVISSGLLDRVLPALRKSVPILAGDVSGQQASLSRFRDFDLLTPTEREVRESQHDFSSGLGAVVWKLMEGTNASRTMITLGKQGLVTFDRDPLHPEERLRSEHLPSLALNAVDSLGCGDALLSAATLTLAAGGSLAAAAYVGSVAAALEVQEVGNQPISAEMIFSKLGGSHAPSVAA